MTGSSTGTGLSTFTASGSRTNNRASSSTMTASSSSLMTSSSTSSNGSHDEHHRTSSSTYHAESSFSSSMVATSTSHRESAGASSMTLTGLFDREYYDQIFQSLQQMWEDTQEAIKKLEAQMLLTARYLTQKLTTVTPQAGLVATAALPTASTLTQRPGVAGVPLFGSFDPWRVR